MKLQIAFDFTDLDKALSVAAEVEPYAQVLEIGTLLLYNHGTHAIKKFREIFPNRILLADAKILDRSRDAVTLFSHAGADWITVMAGASKNVIHTACVTAHELGKKIMLDLTDASSLVQAALDAKSLGVDALVFHKPSQEDEQLSMTDRWEMVRGNTQLPIYIAAPITKESIAEYLSLNPNGLIIGSAITQSSNAQGEANYFAQLMNAK